jgi:hypothetical protein
MCDGCDKPIAWGEFYPGDADLAFCSARCRELEYAQRTRGCRSCGFLHDTSVGCLRPIVSARGVSADALERIGKAMR